MDALELTRALVALETPTGFEGPATDFLDDTLRHAGYHTVRQPVGAGRHNLYAYREPPVLVFSTHLDTVPPYIPLAEDADAIHGRGSCDAKGIAAAQIRKFWQQQPHRYAETDRIHLISSFMTSLLAGRHAPVPDRGLCRAARRAPVAIRQRARRRGLGRLGHRDVGGYLARRKGDEGERSDER